MGGSNPKGVNDGVGNWGQFDPMRQGDAARFEWLGGTESQYQSMTPEQRARWGELARGQDFSGNSKSVQGAKSWMGAQGFGAGDAGGGGAGGNVSEYEKAATGATQNAWGSQYSVKDPVTGQWTQYSDLGPGLGEANSRLASSYAEMLRGGPGLDGSQARDQAIDSAWQQAQSRLNPMWEQQEAKQRTRLLNQGLDPSSEASQNEMGNFGRQRNDAYTSALASAIQQGTAAGDSVFRNNMAARQAPLQQMAMIKALAAQGVPPGLLNALIAQKNNELGEASMLQQGRTDAMNGAFNFAGSALNSFF